MIKLVSAFFIFLLIFSCQSKLTSKEKIIGILPYNGITNREIDSVKSVLKDTYHIKTVVLTATELPKSAFTTVRSPRYRADSIIRIQARQKPDSITIIIGLTNKDISTTKYNRETGEIKSPRSTYKDWGIYGLGQVGGTSCVVSTYRLHNNVSSNTYFTRLKRISTHEVGHVLGLPHCSSKACVMNDANETIKTIDKSTGKLCNKCSDIIGK
jgi:archaemetzincin